jgi:hypothetical protein
LATASAATHATSNAGPSLHHPNNENDLIIRLRAVGMTRGGHRCLKFHLGRGARQFLYNARDSVHAQIVVLPIDDFKQTTAPINWHEPRTVKTLLTVSTCVRRLQGTTRVSTCRPAECTHRLNRLFEPTSRDSFTILALRLPVTHMTSSLLHASWPDGRGHGRMAA